MPCEECRELNTHAFRNADDMVNAVRLAAEELDRGVLKRFDPMQGERDLDNAAHEAMRSVYQARALPEGASYAFECTTCGDRFTLVANFDSGTGGWTRA
ncbi:MAG TPA: hypothetical protein VEC19_11360 [Usitatibacter sp.]|nr:hypothetical protein [Usitatibacter sp.]